MTEIVSTTKTLSDSYSSVDTSECSNQDAYDIKFEIDFGWFNSLHRLGGWHRLQYIVYWLDILTIFFLFFCFFFSLCFTFFVKNLAGNFSTKGFLDQKRQQLTQNH